MDVAEILARELFVQNWWPEGPWDLRREAWDSRATREVKQSWREKARKLQLALAGDGIFIIRTSEIPLWNSYCPETPSHAHCAHWVEGDGECCNCRMPNWCPDDGVDPNA